MPSPEVDGPSTITVTSTAFADGDPVPNRYTCDGDNVAPPFRWHGVPPTPRLWRSWSATPTHPVPAQRDTSLPLHVFALS